MEYLFCVVTLSIEQIHLPCFCAESFKGCLIYLPDLKKVSVHFLMVLGFVLIFLCLINYKLCIETKALGLPWSNEHGVDS